MDQRTTRIVAVRRRFSGETVTSICYSLGKSRRWLYYWLKRYSITDVHWADARSRAPHRHPRKTSAAVEDLVCEIRRRLLARKYAQRGAIAIQWELKRLGIRHLPGLWTINRILRRYGLSTKTTYRPRGTLYPALRPQAPSVVHQLDLVGPRYLRGGTRFYGFQLIDAFSNAVALETLVAKQDMAIVQALLNAWHRLGVPRFLQLDNELSFRGSNRYPRSFGVLVRTCLQLGVEIVFIPEGEPWRNGIVERFNNVYDKLFLRQQWFHNLQHLRRELAKFERFHNQHHRYAKLGQRTPWAVHCRSSRKQPVFVPLEELLQLPWKDGHISFIRLTDHQGVVRFFTERFVVDSSLVHEYVKGTISTRKGILRLFHQGKLIKTIEYKISKNRIM
jgi:putative transposase